MTVRIRAAREEDFAAIDSLVAAAFAPVPESSHDEHELVCRLRGSATFVPQLSLVAQTADGMLVGYVLLTEVEILSEAGPVTSLAVAPLAVVPRFQGRGVGGRLLVEAHRIAARLGYGSALVLGHPGYYPRFGYRPAADFGVRFPFDVPSECCMALELRPRALEGVRGTVRYSDVFFG